MTEHHYSVHLSDEFSDHGRTITATHKTLDGSERENSAFVRNAKQNLCWPLFSKLSPDLRLPQYDAKPLKSRDREMVIADDIPSLSCLIYHVFAMSANREPPLIFNCRLEQAEFSLFKIAVYSNFVNLPTQHLSLYADVATSPQRINNVPRYALPHDKAHLADGAESFPDDRIFGHVHDLNRRLGFGIVEQMISRLRGESSIDPLAEQLVTDLSNHELLFTRYPIAPDQCLVILR
ncbi:hypothetical protein MOP88_10070 [Sphingomonas sp. WKB10]|nr:hypothetical protein [Sphingomonas sp. WKB10]